MTELSADLALADAEARASRERVTVDALRAADWIKSEAMSIFNDLPSDTSQDVRDVIEWYHAQLRIKLTCAALAPAVPQWIPVSEQLPDVEKARCFVIAPGASSGDLWPTEWDAENKVFAAAFGGCFKCSEVTHWMYADRLPAAPGVTDQMNPAVPPGFVLVPVEPTPEMVRAGWELLPSNRQEPWDLGASKARAIFKAMCAAAPSAKEPTCPKN